MVTDLEVGDVGPDRGHHTGEINTQLRQVPLEAGVSAERRRTSAKLRLDAVTATSICPGPGGPAIEGDELQAFQVSRSADLQAHTVVLMVGVAVRRSSGRSGAGRSRAVYHCPLRQAVSSSSDPASSCRATRSASAVLVHVDLSGAHIGYLQRRSPASGHAVPLGPDWPVVGQHRLGFPRHDIQAGWLAGAFRQFAGDPHQMTHLLAAPASGPLIGVAERESGEDHHAVGTAHLDAKLFGAGRMVGVCRQCRILHCAPWVFSASASPAPWILSFGGRGQQPRPGVGVPHGGQFALLPVDRQQAFGQHTLAGAALGDAATQLQPTHGQHHGPVLVEYVEISFRPSPVRSGHPAKQ